MPTAAVRRFLKSAGVTEEEFEEFEAMSDEAIDATVEEGHRTLAAIEWRKKMRRTAAENTANQIYETEDVEKETTMDKTASVVIDRVPPKVRRELASGV